MKKINPAPLKIDSCYNNQMDTKNKIPQIDPELRHRQQVGRQILLPLILIGILCVGFFVLLMVTTTGNPQSVEQWAQISTMFLILPALLLGLVTLLIILAACVLIGKANKGLPIPLSQARNKIIGFLRGTQTLVQKPNRAMIQSKGMLAGLKRLFRNFS